MPKYMPSRSDLKQGLGALGKKGRPRTKFDDGTDPAVSAGLTLPPRSQPAPMGGMPPTRMKNGGSASSRADGIARQGKTKGTMVKMCGGGKA